MDEGEIPFLGKEAAPAHAATNQNTIKPSKTFATPATAAPKTTQRMPVDAPAPAQSFRMPVTAPQELHCPRPNQQPLGANMRLCGMG